MRRVDTRRLVGQESNARLILSTACQALLAGMCVRGEGGRRDGRCAGEWAGLNQMLGMAGLVWGVWDLGRPVLDVWMTERLSLKLRRRVPIDSDVVGGSTCDRGIWYTVYLISNSFIT